MYATLWTVSYATIIRFIFIPDNRVILHKFPFNNILTVAILTTKDFKSRGVDAAGVRFGPKAAKLIRNRMTDIDDDGDADLEMTFQTQETGIACEDTKVSLTGEQVAGTGIIRTIGCR